MSTVSVRTAPRLRPARPPDGSRASPDAGAGATISGRVINALAPEALAELARDLRVALVSATNGKTTTTRLLAAALRTGDAPVTSNSTGANLASGIAPVLGRAVKPGIAALEVDERVVARSR